MIVIYHPGYPNGQAHTRAPAKEVDFLDGDPAICDALVARWGRDERDFSVVATCASREEAAELIRRCGLRCRSPL